MIKTEREYAAAKARLANFQQALEDICLISEMENGVDPVIFRAQRDSVEHQIESIKAEISTYLENKSGNDTATWFSTTVDIGKALINCRISKGMTQRNLAERAGVQEQQIQRYEKDFYQSANLKRLALIAKAMEADVQGRVTTSSKKDSESNLAYGIEWTHYPIAEMRTKGWISYANAGAEREWQKKSALMQFLSDSPAVGRALHRKAAGDDNTKRRASLIAWQTQVLKKACEVADHHPPFQPLSSDEISQLARFSADSNGISSAISLLAGRGIILVVEKHLKGTKIDGAAMSLGRKHAVIGITLRHDRLDNFWFVLLHEIGHLMRHWRNVVDFGIVDEDAGVESAELFEREADEFALNAMIPAETWKSSMVRFTKSRSDVIQFANRLHLHPALVAGRIRHERSYSEFSDLICKVRSEFQAIGLWSDKP
jgi:Predicted transcriptional regulators